MIGDSHAVGVARQVFEHSAGSAGAQRALLEGSSEKKIRFLARGQRSAAAEVIDQSLWVGTGFPRT